MVDWLFAPAVACADWLLMRASTWVAFMVTAEKGTQFFLEPSHAIKEDVRWVNIVAFYRSVEEFGAISPSRMR